VHVVIATRVDPPMALAHLRAQGRLLELRVDKLRFTLEETAEFLNQRMALGLSAGDIETLADRTEGWIVGLQLAALSLKGRTDASAFIHALSGSHRYILDYLVEEVLSLQPGDIQTFLLQTCILERLCGLALYHSLTQLLRDTRYERAPVQFCASGRLWHNLPDESSALQGWRHGVHSRSLVLLPYLSESARSSAQQAGSDSDSSRVCPA
jgi:hypothetical protein